MFRVQYGNVFNYYSGYLIKLQLKTFGVKKLFKKVVNYTQTFRNLKSDIEFKSLKF